MRRAKIRRRRIGTSPAFTLVELLAVVLILGLLVTVAVPRFSSAIARTQAHAAARRIAADLELAGRQAVRSSRTLTISFIGDSYQIPGIRSLDDSAQMYRVNLAAEPYHASVVKVDFGGEVQVSFDAFGTANTSGSVQVQAGKWQHTVVLDADTGKTSID